MRFIMLTRRNDQTLEFDYAKVTEKSRETQFSMFNTLMRGLIHSSPEKCCVKC